MRPVFRPDRDLFGWLLAASVLAVFSLGLYSLSGEPAPRPNPERVPAALNFTGRYTFKTRLDSLADRLRVNKLKLEKELDGHRGSFTAADCGELLVVSSDAAAVFSRMAAPGQDPVLASQAAAAEETRRELEAAAARLKAEMGVSGRAGRASLDRVERLEMRLIAHARGLSARLSR